ncbi:MAG: hypothetical protein KAR36_10015 [Candidatus Latescibacteria bacterium]|nr:hypothetical protein [Candidatus Latescibacterota bacterium]
MVEYFGTDWPEQAVHLDLDDETAQLVAASNKPLCVMDQAGRTVPAQLIRCEEKIQVWYPASLKPHERNTYRLKYGEAAVQRPLDFTVRGHVAELSNDGFGVRLSWTDGAGETYDPPRPLDEMPGPIREVRGPDGVWFGKGAWRSKALCTAFRCEVVERGPVLLIVRQTYELAGGDTLVFEVQLDAATPAVQVLQRGACPTVDADAIWAFHQPGSFEPTHAFWRPHSPEHWRGPKDWRNWNRQTYALRWPEMPDEVFLTAFYNWSRNGAMFWSCWPEQEDRSDMLVVGAIRPSKTRCPDGYRPFVLSASKDDGNHRLTFSTPLQQGEKLFFLGMLDRRGALPDVGVPESRIEGLYRQLQGVDLDAYHHMHLDWEGMDRIRFPHLMIEPDELNRVRKTFKEWTWLRERFEAHGNDRFFHTHDQDDMRIRPEVSTLGSDWAGAYLATGDVGYAEKARKRIGERLDRWVRELSALGPTDDQLIGITFARPWRATCIAFDMIAESDAFTDEERRSFLRKFAFLAEVASTHDAWPEPESGLYRGNPNFHPDYFSAKGISAALLTGHPRQRAWMDYATKEAVRFLRGYHFSNGCSDESATYQLVSLGYVMMLAAAMRHAGGDDLFVIEPMMKKSFDYLAGTQTPRDPRTGFCMLPTIGHVTSYGWSQSLQAYFAWAAKATASSDPEFSKRMMSAWKRAGAMPISLHDWANGMIWWQPLCFIDRDLPEESEPTYPRSKLHEGLGAIFRTVHKNGKEGYLLVKMGPSRGHYDPDEGSLIWYAYGRPVLADFGCQYNPNIECAWLHNRISFDGWNEHGGPFFNVLVHSPGEHVDYVCGEMTVCSLDRWGERPIRETDFDFRLLPGPRAIDPITWRRHVLYIHACEAVVILDELKGAQPTDWNLQVFAEEARIRGRSAHFKGQFGVDLDVYFARPMEPNISISSFEHLGFNEPRLPAYWWKGVRWAAPEGTCFGPMGERALTLRARAEPSEGYLTALVAHPTDEAAPEVRTLKGDWGFKIQGPCGSFRVATDPPFARWQVEVETTEGTFRDALRIED